MKIARWKDRLAWFAMVSVVLLSGAWVQAQQPTPPGDVLLPAIPGLTPQSLNLPTAPVPPPSPYWVGLECFPADSTLRTQLGLPENSGLVVAEVAPDSPAAKADIKQHDVLLSAGDKQLSSVADLIEAINASQGITMSKAGEPLRKSEEAVPAPSKTLTLAVLRAGEKLTIEVTPAAREVNARALPAGPGRIFGPDSRALTNWIEQLRGATAPGQGPLSFWVARPDVIFQGAAELPEDMTITIKKRGKELAQIIVEQGEKSWQVTQDRLAELPDDVRRHVEPLLNPLAQVAPGAAQEIERVERELLGRVRDLDPNGALRSRLEQRLEQLHEQLEGVRRSVEELKKPSADKAAPKKEQPAAKPAEDLPEPKSDASEV
ncbi:MAG: PDZ domain-containing protein [Pirellulales bacterium]|nr:PDZ domain-containing protein [Pirellulales bacterium]